MTSARLLRAAVLIALAGLAACGPYRPGTDGRRPTLQQNMPANAEPEAAGSRPR